MRWDVHYADGAVPLPSVINAVWGSAVLKRGVPYSVQYPSLRLRRGDRQGESGSG